MNAPRFLSDENDGDLLAGAVRYLPGASAWMWSLPPDLNFIVERGEGSRVYDTRGRAYVDYVMGSGPLLLGHAHPAVVQAVQAQVANGSTYFWLSEPTVRLAELICKAVPCGEKIRFVSTGTEATMFAIRMARVFTRRQGIVLIFDEVVTGFRLAYGGAQEFYGVIPDLASYGKALTCGFALGAICGRADLMETADPKRKGTLEYACLSGTLSGNPLASAAGIAALGDLRKPGVYDRLSLIPAGGSGRTGISARRTGNGPSGWATS